MKRIFRQFYLLVIAFLFTATFAKAQSASHQLLLAISKNDHVLAITDATTLKVLAKVPVGEDPHEVIASADGKIAYVSIYGGGGLHTINVIDLVAQKRLADIDTKPLFGPHGLVYVQDKLWFTAEGSKAVGCYDPATQSINWSMGTGQDRTHMIYVTNNAKKIYTTNVSSGTVSILQDTMMQQEHFGPPPGSVNRAQAPHGNMPPPPGMQQRKNWEQTIIPVSSGSEGFDVSPDSSMLWTASAEDGKIFIIDLASKKLAATIDAHVNGANRLKFTPDGKLVLISSLGSANVAVYNAATHQLVKQVNIGNGAAGILMQPDGARAYIACGPDNYIAVVDLKTLTVTSHINVGGEPDGLAWTIQQ